MRPLRIVSRKSKLAMWQATYVKKLLLTAHPELTIEIIPVQTEGDLKLDTRVEMLGGKGVFIKALEEKLLADEADLAVHSLKDLPVTLPTDLAIGAILKRAEVADCFVSPQYASLTDLPPQAKVGTSSLRRRCQIQTVRSDLSVTLLRGNINTRLNKLAAGEYDAIILAACGLQRLGLEGHIQALLPLAEHLPALGQGVLAVEYKPEGFPYTDLLECLHDPTTAYCVATERAFGVAMGGSCQLPLAGLACVVGTTMHFQAYLACPESLRVLRASATATLSDHQQAGLAAAECLKAQGAEEILARL